MLRRFLLSLPVWSLVCGLTAVPSWVLSRDFSPVGKLIGIGAWVMIYSLYTSTEHFSRIWKRRSERVAFALTYGFRATIGFAGMVIPYVIFIDMWCGMFSIGIVEALTGAQVMPSRGNSRPGSQSEIFPTALITFIEGAMLSVVTLVLLTIVRLICSGVVKDRTMPEPRGFEVMPLKPAE